MFTWLPLLCCALMSMSHFGIPKKKEYDELKLKENKFYYKKEIMQLKSYIR